MSSDEEENASAIPANLFSVPCDDIAELFSPPRLIPLCRKRGLRGEFSADLKTGWNFLRSSDRLRCLHELAVRRPKILMNSSPCTFYSALQRLWNHKKLSPPVLAQRKEEATTLMNFALLCLEQQLARGGAVCHEHPSRASSWDLPRMQMLASQDGVFLPVFDQCSYGLVSPQRRTPLQKRTRLLTTIKEVNAEFAGKLCHERHHGLIQGNEGGHRLSVWCQHYPMKLCSALADCFASHCLRVWPGP